MTKRTIALLLATIAVASCGGSPSGSSAVSENPGPTAVVVATDGVAPTAPSSASASPTPTVKPAAPTPAPTASPTADPPLHVELKGSGSKVARFSWPDGEPALVTLTYKGSDNFIVTPLDSDGTEGESLANVIGSWHGRVLLLQSAVALRVQTNGTWTITLDSPLKARSWDGTGVLNGASSDVVIVSPATSGLTTWKITHKGQENVIIEALSPAGMDNIVNEIGNWSGEVPVPDGTLMITIDADGTWTVTPTG